MAQLHGRVLGLPDRRRGVAIRDGSGRTGVFARWALAAALLVSAVVPGRAVASGGGLARAAEDLGSDDARARQRAWRWLSGLGPEHLPAIRERIDRLAERRLEAEPARDALYDFRHAVGSRRADDMVDIAPGVLPVLREKRDRTTVAMAERLALARALEGMGSLAAGRALCDLMGIEDRPWPWRWESKRMVGRMGVRSLPTLLVAAGHDRRFVRRWARWGVGELGLGTPGEAVRRAEGAGVGVLADLLRAYGEARIMDAMPVVVAFVDDPRRRVRRAARAGVEGYGRNIIWQLRRAYELQTGEEASTAWGTERTRSALYEAIDGERLAPVRAALEAGLAALREGDLAAMERHFERVLRDAPAEPRLEAAMAGGWAALGDARMDRGAYEGARQAYRRALASGGAAPAQAARWRARSVLAEAEASLSRGVVDLPGYRRALELDPELSVAADAVDRLSGSAAERARTRRRWASAVAALLLAFAGAGLLRRTWHPTPPEDDKYDDFEPSNPSYLSTGTDGV